MPVQTPEQYYSDEQNFGSYQFVSLQEIIDGFWSEITGNDDHYLKGTKRSLLLRYAKNAIREVTRSNTSRRASFTITVPTSLSWPVPQDYVMYSSISLVELDQITGSYYLHPIDVSTELNTAIDYLQDNNGDLLFDNDGYILEAEGVNAFAQPYQRYRYRSGDASKLSGYGEVSIDTDRGLMAFSSDLSEKTIRIVYVTDGLEASLSESEIMVHKYLRDTIETYIYHKGVERNRNVGRGEKIDAKIAYKTAKHQAKLAMMRIDLLQIARTLRANPIP